MHLMFTILTKIQIWAEIGKQSYFVKKNSKISSNFVLISYKIDFNFPYLPLYKGPIFPKLIEDLRGKIPS